MLAIRQLAVTDSVENHDINNGNFGLCLKIYLLGFILLHEAKKHSLVGSPGA
ncbi:hypothetical protein KCTCHS21_28810 [Cohnella abietis]|uniref:Uncharacterized protein n=1 Tax=Cohnella abietis TaxID=2507935 RepID=A0A3T1D5T9_9BACL|nr:hypothetical protein KCTCHS21_28810 [Cohnella abietis]